MTTTATKKKQRKRARSLTSSPTKADGRPERAMSVDKGTAAKDRITVTESTPTIQVLDTVTSPTGPLPQGPTPTVVRPKKTLAQLHMGSGSLDTILPDSGWPTLATNLKKDFVSPLEPKKESLAELCTVYYKSGQQAQTALKDAGKLTTHVPEVVAFLEKFMEANGQWDYIKDQDWFKKDGNVIAIEVNYYTNRAGAGALPGFHKDTGGDNVFVNLVFDNDDTIEATEWLPDAREPSKARMAWQKGLLPASYQTDLTRARRALGATQDPTSNVAGGTVGKNAYVSWVDDLVWHATPTAKQRIVFDDTAAKTAYSDLDATVDGYFAYQNPQGNWIRGSEMIATMAEEPGFHLSAWMARNDLRPQDIDETQAKKAWKELYGGNSPTNMKRFAADTKVRAKLPWRLTGNLSEASAPDSSLPGSRSITEVPGGLSKRRRANSLPPSKELADARAKNTPRNFIRTWVRILPPTTKIPTT